ncbi:MAG: hypothetical protein RLZZ71_145 [Bacteroidota bacterium]
MKKLAIIPARAGSKRIPRKNIRTFLGKPVIAYSIEAALNTKLFDEVMVSTDDLEIARIAKDYGARVPFLRSEKMSNDHASTMDVIEEVLKEYGQFNQIYESVCCIYACAPFVNAERILEGYNLMVNKNFDSVFPVLPFGFPIQRALRVSHGKITYFSPEHALSRSQDLEKGYHDAGQFYWMNPVICSLKKGIFTDNSGGLFISELEGQDIDNESDWKLAELKYEFLQSIK